MGNLGNLTWLRSFHLDSGLYFNIILQLNKWIIIVISFQLLVWIVITISILMQKPLQCTKCPHKRERECAI